MRIVNSPGAVASKVKRSRPPPPMRCLLACGRARSTRRAFPAGTSASHRYPVVGFEGTSIEKRSPTLAVIMTPSRASPASDQCAGSGRVPLRILRLASTKGRPPDADERLRKPAHKTADLASGEFDGSKGGAPVRIHPSNAKAIRALEVQPARPAAALP